MNTTRSAKPALSEHPDWETVLEPYYRDDKDPSLISSGSHDYVRVSCPECGYERGIPARNAIAGRLLCRSCAAKHATVRPRTRQPYLTELPNWDSELEPLYKDEKDPSTLRLASTKKIVVECPDCHEEKIVDVYAWAQNGQLRCRSCSARRGKCLDSTDSWKENAQWYRDLRNPHTIPFHSTAISIEVACPECHELRSITPFAFTQGKLRHKECASHGHEPRQYLDEVDNWDELSPYYKDKRDPHTIAARGSKMIVVECPSCHEVRKIRACHFTESGSTCQACSIETNRFESKLEAEARRALEALNLKQYGFALKQQWPFPLKTGGIPRTADFAILDASGSLVSLFEIQGGQHYDYCEFYHPTREEWIAQLERDQWKRDYCHEHGIPLMELCYIENEAQRRHNIIGFLTTIGVLPLSAYASLTSESCKKAA
jgi:ribosomal protein S27E